MRRSLTWADAIPFSDAQTANVASTTRTIIVASARDSPSRDDHDTTTLLLCGCSQIQSTRSPRQRRRGRPMLPEQRYGQTGIPDQSISWAAVLSIRSRQASLAIQLSGMVELPYREPASCPATAAVVSASSPRLAANERKFVVRETAHSAALR